MIYVRLYGYADKMGGLSIADIFRISEAAG